MPEGTSTRYATSMPNIASNRAGVIGHPLAHSVSPVLQQKAFDSHGLPVRYLAWETTAAQLAERMAELRRPEVLGANVTVPHKQAVMSFLAHVDQEARFVGAVNTIAKPDGSENLVGFNTDVPGFLRALREDGGFEPRARTALLLGAGGAGLAVAYALAKEGIRLLYVANRQPARTEGLARALTSVVPGFRPQSIAWSAAALVPLLPTCDLIVNATTLGMRHGPGEGESPLAGLDIPTDCTVFDLVYNPLETPLLRQARERGARAVGGLSMLVYQGAESFRIWTGLAAPVEAMMEAAHAALSGRGSDDA